MPVMFTWDVLPKMTGGEWLALPVGGSGAVAVLDESTGVGPGSLFVAIGKGHQYLDQVVSKGAAAVCVDQLPSAEQLATWKAAGIGCLRVAESLAALHALAAAHRRCCRNLTVVGVTGSCGKTTTKEMLAAVLTQRLGNAVLKTAGNWNNHFGLPRMLLRLAPEHRVAVLEMGTNHPGEISVLTALARPDIAVVTNVGQAHLEHLGSLDGVAREKGCLFEGLPAGGLAVFDAGCAQAEILRQKASGRRILTFGHGLEADVRGTYLGRRQDGGFGVELFFRASGTRRVFSWEFAGSHQALNAAVAALVGAELGLSADEIVAGLQGCVVPGMRMLRREIAGTTWINDAYNANPESMKASLSCLADAVDTATAAHVLVLGDMLELGTAQAAAHLDVLRFARRTFPGAIIIAVGPLMQEAARHCGETAVADTAAARPLLEREIKPHRIIFLKASRGMGLETLMPPEK